MNYKAYTQEQIDEMSPKKEYKQLLPGKGSFMIKKVEETTSKASGNEMIKLSLEVYDSEGTRGIVFDNITLTESMAWKLRHLADSCGVLDKYEAGTLSETILNGKSGECILIKEKATEKYPESIKVKDYIKRDDTASAPSDTETYNDEIPF